jgi:hypothetical protein
VVREVSRHSITIEIVVTEEIYYYHAEFSNGYWKGIYAKNDDEAMTIAFNSSDNRSGRLCEVIRFNDNVPRRTVIYDSYAPQHKGVM